MLLLTHLTEWGMKAKKPHFSWLIWSVVTWQLNSSGSFLKILRKAATQHIQYLIDTMIHILGELVSLTTMIHIVLKLGFYLSSVSSQGYIMYKQGQLFCLMSIWSAQVCETQSRSPLFIVKYGRRKEAYLTISSLTWVKWRWEIDPFTSSSLYKCLCEIWSWVIEFKILMQTKRLSSLLNEDPAIMERRTGLAKRLELYRSAQTEIDAVAWSK